MFYRKILESRLSGDEGGSSLVVLLFVSVMLILSSAFVYRVFFDRVIPEGNAAMAWWVLGFLIVVEILGVGVNLLANLGLARMHWMRTCRERRNFNERIWRINPGWFNSQGSGAIVRYFEDTCILGGIRSLFLKEVVRPIFILFLLLPAMFFTEPLLALSRVICILPSLLAGRFFLHRDLILEREIWQLRRLITTGLQRGGRGLKVIKLGRGGDGFRRFMTSQFYTLGQLEIRRATLGARWEGTVGIIDKAGSVLNMGLVVYLIMSGSMGFGAYIAFSIISAHCMWAISHLFRGLRGMGLAGNAMRRHQYLFNQDYDRVGFVPEKGSDVFVPCFSEGLRIRRLFFSYLPDQIVLKDISMDVAPEEKVWLKGGSGSGKSTLMGIILGLYRPDSGYLGFAGVDFLDCSFERRRGLVGAVFQEAVFFDGTVRENLTVYGPVPSDRVLWEALERASAKVLVESFPQGLNTTISGEFGRLSGGEKQKLAVARLLVCRPPLIILDEPLNALDVDSARVLRDLLDAACLGSTVIAISHDTVPPVRVNRYFCLDEGRILREGSCVQGCE